MAAAMAGRVGVAGLPRPWALDKQRRTPVHPPYSEMIQAAIGALAEGGGSTVAAIDRHIRSAYPDLPWGHHNLLPYYLRKLAAAGEIARTHSGRYALDDDDTCCADVAEPPTLPGIPNPSPPRNPSEGQDGTPSRPNFITTEPAQLGGDGGGLANGDLVDGDAPLAMSLPRHPKGAGPHLSIRRLKQKLRERSTSSSSPCIGHPVGFPVVRRRGRPPKPKAAIVLEDDRKEGVAGHEGRESETKLVATPSTADPTVSPVRDRRGWPPKHKDAIILKDDRREAGSREQGWQPERMLSGTSTIGDPAIFPVIKRRGRPPKRGPAMNLQGEQREVATGRQDLQSEPPLISSFFIEAPVSSPVIKRRVRPPQPKALPDPQQEPSATVGHEDPQPELKLVTSSSMGDLTSSAASAPVKRRGRPPKSKADQGLP